MQTSVHTRIWPIVIILLASLLSCKQVIPDSKRPVSRSKHFFDLENYFEAEMEQMNLNRPNGIKVVHFKDKSDTIQLKDALEVDYKEELIPFKASDINRTDWEGKYHIDSVFRYGKLEMLRYTALDKTLKTQEITLVFKYDTIQEIKIRNRIKSIIAESAQILTYMPSRGYAVSGNQQMRLGQAYSFEVSVSFFE